MRVFTLIVLSVIIGCAFAGLVSSDNSRPANQIITVITSEETTNDISAEPELDPEPSVIISPRNVNFSPYCLVAGACNAACIRLGWTGGFCDGQQDCYCWRYSG